MLELARLPHHDGAQPGIVSQNKLFLPEVAGSEFYHSKRNVSQDPLRKGLLLSHLPPEDEDKATGERRSHNTRAQA